MRKEGDRVIFVLVWVFALTLIFPLFTFSFAELGVMEFLLTGKTFALETQIHIL